MSFYTLAFIALFAGQGICADFQKTDGWNVTSSASRISSTPSTTLTVSTSQSRGESSSPNSPSILTSTPSLSQNGTDNAMAPTTFVQSSPTLLHSSRQSSETEGSTQPSLTQSSPLVISSNSLYSTGVLPGDIQTIQPKVPTDLSSSVPVASSSQIPSALSSGANAQESTSPTAQAVQGDSHASSTQDLAIEETKSTTAESDVQDLSSTWQVGISPSAHAASSTSSSQLAAGPTSNSGYGGLGSFIWSGLSGSLPTDNVDSGNLNLGGSSGYASANGINTIPVAGKPGYTATSPARVAPDNGFGTGSVVGTGTEAVYPGTTTYTYETQTGNSQGGPTLSSSSAFYSPKYSFSWKFNTSTTRRPIASSKVSHLPLPLPSPSGSDNGTNETCGGITVNIPNATLDYWYTTTLDYAAATFSIQFDSNDSATGWTLLPATTTFNVTDALQDPTTYYVPTTITHNAANTSISYYTTVDVSPTPVYASTAVVTQTATAAINSTSGVGAIPADAVITPPPASTVLSAGPHQPSLTALTNTHFVYFSQYALDSEHTTTHKNGTPACVTSRQIKNLGHNFAMAYLGDNPDGQALVTGDLSEEFLKLLPSHLELDVGVFTAAPTLIVPVQIDYAAEAVLAVSQPATTPMETSYGSYPFAYSTAFSVGSYQVVPTLSQPPAFAPVASNGPPRPPLIFLKPTSTSTIAITNTQLATNFYIISPTSTTVNVEKTQTALDLPNPGPTKIPVGGQTGANGDANSDSRGDGSASQGSGGSGTGSNGGSNSNGDASSQSGGSSGSSNAGNDGSNPGGSSQGSGSGGSNSGSNAGTSNPSPDSGNFNSGSGSGSDSSSGNSGSSSDSGNSGNSGSSSGTSNSGGSNSGNSDTGGSSLNGGSTSSGDSTGSDSSGNSGSDGNVIVPVPVVINVGSTQATINPGSTVIIGTQTLEPQKAAVIVDGTPVSIGPTAVVVGAETHAFQGSTLQAAGPVTPTAITYGNSVITQAPVPVYNFGGTSVHAGEIATISGTVVSAASSGGVLAIGSNTISVGTPSSAITLSTAGRQVIVNPTPAFVIGGQILAAGGPAVTVDGTQLSLAPSATAIVVGSETSQIAAPVNPTRGAILTVGSQTFTADASTRFSIAPGVTLTPGGSATVDGKTVHLGPSGFLASLAVVDGVTQTLSPPLITPPPTFYLGGNAYGTGGGAAFVVDGQVLTPGGAITVSGTPVSFVKEGTAVVVGGFTQMLPQPSAVAAPVLDFGGEIYTAQADSAFVIGGQTLTRGGALTISGTKISYASEGTAVVINGVTQALTPASSTSTPVLTVGGQIYTARVGSNFVIDGATLIPGGQVTVDGTTISLAEGGTAAVVNGITRTLTQGTAASRAVLTIGGRTYTAGSGPNFVIGGQTLIPGQIITFDGTSVSLASDGIAMVVNGVTQTLAYVAPTKAAVLTIGSQTYTAQSGASYVIEGQTLYAGSAVTIDGTTISLMSGGTAAVINGVTQSLPMATAAAVINLGGQAYTAQSGTFVIGGQTLKPGGVITLDGTTVSLDADETIAVVNGATTTLAQVTAPAALTLGGHTYAAQTGSSYVIGGKTLTPGGVVTLAGGTTISLASSGSFVVINSVTSSISHAAGATPTSVLTVGGKTFTASSGSYVIDGQTLTSGGVVTLSDGTTLSLGASVLIINGQTSTLPTAQSVSPGIITIGDQIFTSLAGNTAAPSYIIDGQTLQPAGTKITATMSGTTYIITLDAGASTVEIEVLGAGGTVMSTIYETLRGSGIGASTVTATQEIQGGAAASSAARPSLTATPTKGSSASLQNAAAPRSGFVGMSVALAALLAGALAVLL
ncbi:hypothetical protein QM012_002772 [Aureobasidium pullulans]|uniref:Uncharacterized protein n=1 Tax=Aureobasidium pullulans TaxID=5580 RepID=A0ABR0TAH8_AURPU